MTYKLTIDKFSRNPQYEEQMKEYNDRSRYSAALNVQFPQFEISERHLEVSITEVEFLAIKKAVLETM